MPSLALSAGIVQRSERSVTPACALPPRPLPAGPLRGAAVALWDGQPARGGRFHRQIHAWDHGIHQVGSLERGHAMGTWHGRFAWLCTLPGRICYSLS